MKCIHHIILWAITLLLIGCSDEDFDYDMSKEYPGLRYNSFTITKKIFTNPERGLYVGQNWYSAQDPILTLNFMRAQRSKGITIMYTGYYLTDFMESDISQEYLDMIDANMQALREGGVKCLLRFAYKTDMYETGHPWDAKPEWVHRHIEQLKPVMQRNSDVVLCLQAGFIGVWGEWAITDHFIQSPKTPEEHALRKDVFIKLLDAMPENRQIALRTPMFKRMMFLDSYADSITFETAFNGSELSRICGHNDCFGADASDMGTFINKETREFWKRETRYVMMGGETCQMSKFCKCEQSLKDMEEFHWTYLSGPSRISDSWEEEGCFDEIKRRLGYRIALRGVHYTAQPAPGADFRVVIQLKNMGFAAPANPRAVELVLIDGNGKRTVYELKDIDPRYWFAGDKVTIDRIIRLPDDACGDCTLYFNLPDPEERLHDNPFFSIRTANGDIWDKSTGYNKLLNFMI